MSRLDATPKKGMKKWQVWALIIGALIVIGLIGSALGLGSKETPNAAATPPPAQSQTATPEPETDAPEEPAESLAETVWKQVEANFPDGISTNSPLFPVTDVEDVSAGTIRVFVQETLTDDGRDTVARHVFNMGGLDNDDLKTVVVRDASGRDSNHYR